MWTDYASLFFTFSQIKQFVTQKQWRKSNRQYLKKQQTVLSFPDSPCQTVLEFPESHTRQLWIFSAFYSPLYLREFTQNINIDQRKGKQDQVHLASRTHFVDLVIHDICSQKIIPYFADLVIHNICSQKIMPYFFDKLSTSIRNFAQWASTFCFSFLNCFRFWVKFLFGKKFLGENFFG